MSAAPANGMTRTTHAVGRGGRATCGRPARQRRVRTAPCRHCGGKLPRRRPRGEDRRAARRPAERRRVRLSRHTQPRRARRARAADEGLHAGGDCGGQPLARRARWPPAGPVLVTLAESTPKLSYLWPQRILRQAAIDHGRSRPRQIPGHPRLHSADYPRRGMARWGPRAARGRDSPVGRGRPGRYDRPRLDALGADVTRVHALTAMRNADGAERGLCLAADVAHLEASSSGPARRSS